MNGRTRVLYLVLPAFGLAVALLPMGSSVWVHFYPQVMLALFVHAAAEPVIGGTPLLGALAWFTMAAGWLATAHVIVWLAGLLKSGGRGPAPEAVDLASYVLTGIAVLFVLYLTRALLMPVPPGGDLLAGIILVATLSVLIPPPVIIAYRAVRDECRRIRERLR